MEISNNSKNYETVSLSTVGDLGSCNTIVLYKTYSSLNKLNLGKLINSIENNYSIEKLIGTTKYIELSRESITENFIYDRTPPSVREQLPDGFNTVVYLNYKRAAIGYTEFSSVQGTVSERLDIKLDFRVNNSFSEDNSGGDNDSGDNEGGDYSTTTGSSGIVNDLSTIINSRQLISQKIKSLLNSDKLYGFTNINKINNELSKSKDIYPRYTKNLTELLRNPEMNIYLGFGVCNSLGLGKINLIKEMTIAKDLVNHQLGYYRGEVVLYSWKKENNKIFYSVHSMSRRDKFGNSVNYTNTYTGTKEINNYPNENFKIKDIRYFSGKYISVVLSSSQSGTSDEIFAAYNIDAEKWVALDSNNHVMDLWGIDSQIIELPDKKELSIKTLTSFCPDIINTHVDIKNYPYKIDLVKKVGEWYVLNQIRQSEKDKTKRGSFKIYTNINKTIVLSNTSDYLDEDPVFLNNNVLALKTKTDHGSYYTYFLKDGISYSENALTVMSKMYNLGKDISIPNHQKPDKITNANDVVNYYQINAFCDTDYKLFEATDIISNICGDNNDLIYSYGNGLLVDHIGDNFVSSYLQGFRKNLCPSDLKIPEIIGSINGLIYYKTKNNKIKLL